MTLPPGDRAVVTLTTAGGFAPAVAARRPPRVVDTSRLEPPDAAHLRHLLEAVERDGAEHPGAQPPGAGRRGADALSYAVRIEDAAGAVTLHADDLTMTPAFGALVTWIEEHAAAR